MQNLIPPSMASKDWKQEKIISYPKRGGGGGGARIGVTGRG